MIVLDTDALSIVQRGARSADYARLSALLSTLGDDDIAITVISVEEQARGWLAQLSQARQATDQVVPYQRLRVLVADYARRTILDFTPEASGLYSTMRSTYRRHGSADLKIAAIVMAHDALLVSRNTRDFESIVGLRFQPFR